MYKRGKNNHCSIKSGINMTEQPNEQNKQPTPQIEKLLIDNPSNFQFHAAYLVYSEAFDKANEEMARKELNQHLEDLQANKIDYQTFYVNISHYRKLEQMPRQGGKFTVATQRKKDWRMKTQRQERIKRHKK
jgi:predicted aldo/keto reductase-like oxidoreductase